MNRQSCPLGSKCPAEQFIHETAQAIITRPAKSKDETAWLIEFAGPTYYGQGDEGLNVYADEKTALRFSRKEDAEMVIADIGWTAAKAVEHMWCAPRASASA